jgi:hypothetical protein
MAANEIEPNQSVPLTGSGQIEIAEQIEIRHYRILISEWQYLKKIVYKIECNRDHFQKIGYLLIGSSISLYISSIKMNDEMTKVNFQHIALGCFIIGIILIFFDYKLAKSTVYTKRLVLEQMDLIERKFESTPYNPEVITKRWYQFWK